MWNYEGMRVSGNYLGFPVTGVVTLSRAVYGKGVKHYVTLDEVVQLPWRTDKTDCVVLLMEEVTQASFV